MLQAAKVMRGGFIADQAEFAAYDSNLAHPFEDHWQEAIDNCGVQLDDETIRDQLQQHTAKVKAAMKACHNKFMDTKYFIRKAFPDNLGMWQAFGFDTFAEETRQQVLMIQFMQVFHIRAVDHSAQLNAVGYSNADIAEIETLCLQLTQANLEQDMFKGARGSLTGQRMNDLNDLWNIMQDINRVARSIYRDDYVAKKRYQLPVRVGKKKVDETPDNP